MNKIPLSLSALKSPNKIYKSDFKINSLNLSSCAFLFHILYVIIVLAVQKLLQCFLFDFRRFFFFCNENKIILFHSFVCFYCCRWIFIVCEYGFRQRASWLMMLTTKTTMLMMMMVRVQKPNPPLLQVAQVLSINTRCYTSCILSRSKYEIPINTHIYFYFICITGKQKYEDCKNKHVPIKI